MKTHRFAVLQFSLSLLAGCIFNVGSAFDKSDKNENVILNGKYIIYTDVDILIRLVL